MEIACLDLEGVLIPEIWVAFAEKTGIKAPSLYHHVSGGREI